MNGKYEVGDICLFDRIDLSRAPSRFDKFQFFNKRLPIWGESIRFRNQIGVILQTFSLKEIVNQEYEKYLGYTICSISYEKKSIYLWYCFKTAKTYLVYHREMKDK